MTNDLKTWKRNTAVRRFNQIKAEAETRGRPTSDIWAAMAAAEYVDATKDQVLRWVREAGR